MRSFNATWENQLEGVRARAEAAHLETVIQEQIVVEFESQGRDASAAKVKTSTWKMAEQKLIIQMNSILDRLDETGRRRPGCRRSRPSLRSLGRAPLNR